MIAVNEGGEIVGMLLGGVKTKVDHKLTFYAAVFKAGSDLFHCQRTKGFQNLLARLTSHVQQFCARFLYWLLPAGLLRSVTATAFFLGSGLDDPVQALRGHGGIADCRKVFKADDLCVARQVGASHTHLRWRTEDLSRINFSHLLCIKPS